MFLTYETYYLFYLPFIIKNKSKRRPENEVKTMVTISFIFLIIIKLIVRVKKFY